MYNCLHLLFYRLKHSHLLWLSMKNHYHIVQLYFFKLKMKGFGKLHCTEQPRVFFFRRQELTLNVFRPRGIKHVTLITSPHTLDEGGRETGNELQVHSHWSSDCWVTTGTDTKDHGSNQCCSLNSLSFFFFILQGTINISQRSLAETLWDSWGSAEKKNRKKKTRAERGNTQTSS